jgi:hypothetical protein
MFGGGKCNYEEKQLVELKTTEVQQDQNKVKKNKI